MNYYAHSKKNEPLENWQPLEDHLENVSTLAADFARPFGGEDWARLAGLWHDLGKFTDAFQAYMLEGASAVEHAVVGGRYANDVFPEYRDRRLALQFCITCHHTGLQNREHIRERLVKATDLLGDAIKNAPQDLLNKALPEWPVWLAPPSEDKHGDWARSLEFWIRMLHSCLVDADWLDAEKRDLDNSPRPEFPSVSCLRDKLDRKIDEKVSEAKRSHWTPVNMQREVVLDACRKAAKDSPEFFSLTVPTGGGKTLSGMSFALNHAVENELNRVIVVIPYTSIIKQNSNVYADIFGQENVIEHHSSLTPAKDTERNRLASENWDAPVVVTTNVQFFESLFACKNSKLRKLHNIAKSVIILDEVQSLPPRLLYPIMEAMKELQSNYGCSIVFSTATQPALNKRESFLCGLAGIKEIIPNTVKLARNLARVKVEWDTDEISAYADIAARISSEKMVKVLAVTHKRADARELAELLPEGTLHLSASMCPAHRDAVLNVVRERLLCESKSVRLVSTQLIEAGVDIDFPVVFRALAGLDSISQTAGRCNREGRLRDENGNLIAGRLVVFRAPSEPPPGVLRLGKGVSETLLNMDDAADVPLCPDGSLDLCSPAIFQTYFKFFYSGVQKDGAGVQEYRSNLDYPEVAKRFKMIGSETVPVVVPYKKAYEILDGVRSKFKPSRKDFRSLQQFIVQIYPQEFDRLERVGALEPLHEKAFYFLTPQFERLYDECFGLITEEANLYADIDTQIVDD